jgi:hypothetical protein
MNDILLTYAAGFAAGLLIPLAVSATRRWLQARRERTAIQHWRRIGLFRG